MSAFLALTLKSSRKSASLWKGDQDPRNEHMCGRIVKISKDMLVLKQDMALAYDLPFFLVGGGGEVCPLGCLEKACIPSPFLRSCQKLGGGGRSHFHVNNSLLVIPFLVFLMLHEDRFCGFVLVTRWVHMRSTYIEECCFSSWPELPAFMSSIASGLVTVDRRWSFTSTSLQTLLSRDVRMFWMPSCLCATKSPLHNRARLTVNRSPHVGSNDPLAMPWYAINTSINLVLYNWYKLFSQEGKKFGYLVNGSKSWLIVKPR